MNILLIIFCIAILCEIIDAGLGMGYGTILSPLLLLFGFSPLHIVPAILVSQAIGGIIASASHHNYQNVDLGFHSKDIKYVYIISTLGIIAAIIAVFLNKSIPKVYIKTYIGILISLMGIILLCNKKYTLTLKKTFIIGVLSAFNKALSGGGFGPVVTGGQIMTGQKNNKAIGITTACEVPICIVSFVCYIFFKPDIHYLLMTSLICGAIIGAPFGSYITKCLRNYQSITQYILGTIILLLGILTLWKVILQC